MYLLYADESGVEAKPGRFFVYGGVAVPVANAPTLSAEIDKLLARHKWLDTEEPLKFSGCRPKHIDAATYKAIKQEVIRLAGEGECRLLVVVVLHDIAKKDELRGWQINTLVSNFQTMLEQEKVSGLVLLDTFKEEQTLRSMAKRIFRRGLTYYPDHTLRRMTRVLGIHESHAGASHFASITDIAVGCFRYGVNDARIAGDDPLATTLLRQLAPLLPRVGSAAKVPDVYLDFSPSRVQISKYRDPYRDALRLLDAAGVSAQSPPNLNP